MEATTDVEAVPVPGSLVIGDEVTVHSPSETTMRAVVQRTYGSADVLQVDDIDMPAIGANEVLLQVTAAGMDRGTWHLLRGLPYLMRIMGFGFRGPKNPVPGLDVAGTVISIGDEVTRFKPGDQVFGVARGSYAEYAAALEVKLSPKPPSLTFEQAAVVPVSGLTALQALQAGRVEAGQKVLVIGASGGVGTYAVQLAKAMGAEVTGVCSTSKLDLVRSIGADRVIDYTSEDFADGVTRYDLILDLAGNNPLPHLRRALAPKGTLVIVGGEDGGRWTGGFGRSFRAVALSPFVGQRLTMIASKEHHDGLEELTRYIEGGKVGPVIDRTYPLTEVPEAMRHLEAGRARGKISIRI